MLEIVTGQKIERFFDHANIVPLRGFEGVRYVEIPVTTIGPVPELLKIVQPTSSGSAG